MVTWTFDLVAFVVGFIVGVIIGLLSFLIAEWRDGGSWSKGLYDGCRLKYIVEKLEKIVEAKREGD